MSLFTPEELADLTAETLEALPDTCTIQRPQITDDGKGGRTKTFPALATGVKCRVDPTIGGASEGTSGGKVTGTTEWYIWLPAGQDVKAIDRIVVTSLGSRVFEVQGVRSGSYEVTKRVSATEVI